MSTPPWHKYISGAMGFDTTRTAVILRDSQGHFFMEAVRIEGKRRNGFPVADVKCERGTITVVDGKLMHWDGQQRHHYEAEQLMAQSDPPAGLRMDRDGAGK